MIFSFFSFARNFILKNLFLKFQMHVVIIYSQKYKKYKQKYIFLKNNTAFYIFIFILVSKVSRLRKTKYIC